MRLRIKSLLVAVSMALLSLSDFQCAAASEISSPDSTVLASLGKKLTEYVGALAPLDLGAQEEECDFLISSCRDSVTRQYVASWLYRHYQSSHLMGVESVALHIADNWFFTGKISAVSEADLMDMRIWADFNRQSMVGETAPELSLFEPDGKEVHLFGSQSSPRYSVVYFYDTGCSNCLVQSVMLKTYLDSVKYPIDVYAVYTGADSLAWKVYREKRLSATSSSAKIYNLWDPDISSDFQRKYGVLSTPQMVLVDKSNKIVGRKLDVPALRTIMSEVYSSDDYEYGADSTSRRMIENIFGSLGDDFTVSDMERLVDKIASRAEGNVVAFKETMGDILYFLLDVPDGRYRESAKYLADKYILSRQDVWDTSSDTLKVVGYAKTMSDLISRAEPGKAVPDVSVVGIMAKGGVPSSVLSWKEDNNSEAKKWRLRKLRRDVYVMFFSESCSSCREEVEAANEIMKADKNARFLFVRASAAMSEEVLDAFDLSVLPFCVHIDRKGVVLERYVDLKRLGKNLLE